MDPNFAFHRHHAHPHTRPHGHPHTRPHAPPHPPHPVPIPETVFRLLCPSSKAGGVIGKGGAVIRQLREQTGARIRVIDDVAPPPHSDERMVLVAAPTFDGAVAQAALFRVFERMFKVEEEESVRGASENGELGFVVCRLLAPSSQVGSVLGRGGKIIEKIRHESGARVRVLPRDDLPPCASPGDELIQISGSYPTVKKALVAVSTCLMDHPKGDIFHPDLPCLVDSFPQKGLHVPNHHYRGFSMMACEEEVVFRLLCQTDKIGCLIGKGGCIIRGIENETGATIKIGDVISPHSDECVVVILAREYFDVERSCAQDAVIRVHRRITEVGFETGVPVTARLLIHSQQIGPLLGKGGHIIAEMRRLSGASIRVFGREQSSKFINSNDEVVQVSGSTQCVHDALLQITNRLREIVFHPRSIFPEFPSPSFHHGYEDLPHSYDNRAVVGPHQPHPCVISSHGVDRISGANNEQLLYHYDGPSYGPPPFEGPLSPRSGYTQVVNNENHTGYSDTKPGPSRRTVTNTESGQMPMETSVEVSIPQTLLPHIYGENRSNLSHITQLSGADVVVHDPKAGDNGQVVISGTPSQCHTAQTLVHAFILCGQPF